LIIATANIFKDYCDKQWQHGQQHRKQTKEHPECQAQQN
jgi:hypothetical protein